MILDGCSVPPGLMNSDSQIDNPDPLIESISPEHHHDIRPLCPCCGGKDRRKGYKYTKAKSHKLNQKNRRAKPKRKDHR